jgi:hypothetical protein
MTTRTVIIVAAARGPGLTLLIVLFGLLPLT